MLGHLEEDLTGLDETLASSSRVPFGTAVHVSGKP